jgi:N-acetylglucosaminyldiphosphoundecaprenol N-acetyl-beta-D-mannosaminyltransferase
MESIDILGCRLDSIDADEATRRIMEFSAQGAGAQVVTLGTEMVVYAQRDERFRTIVNNAALSLCDTVGLLAVARRRGAKLRQRVTGVELLDHLCASAARSGVSVYFIGGAAGVAADAAAILESRFPGLVVAGTHNGFFDAEDVPSIVESIRKSGAHLLFAGLGSPRQEFFLADHLRASGCGAGIGVGGSFDVISGRVVRAPLVWRKYGVEWLYRLLREPQRWRRQLALPHFVWLILLGSFKTRSKEGN